MSSLKNWLFHGSELCVKPLKEEEKHHVNMFHSSSQNLCSFDKSGTQICERSYQTRAEFTLWRVPCLQSEDLVLVWWLLSQTVSTYYLGVIRRHLILPTIVLYYLCLDEEINIWYFPIHHNSGRNISCPRILPCWMDLIIHNMAIKNKRILSHRLVM